MNNQSFSLTTKDLSIRKGSLSVIEHLSFSIPPDGHLAITGAAGSGKTTLAQALAGRIFFSGEISFSSSLKERIVWVEQSHHFKNRSNVSNFYYQQRFNAIDADDALTVSEYLAIDHADNALLQPFGIADLLTKPLIQLSNGENKKVQISRALLLSPKVLVLDQPFVGLDVTTRAFLHDRINQLAAGGMMIILVTQPDEMPACVTHVLSLHKGGTAEIEEKARFMEKEQQAKRKSHPEVNQLLLDKLISTNGSASFERIIEMRDVGVAYGDRTILSDIDWEVRPGDCWLLSGPNGAGKSTLLSLINGDNPQAYANHISLFDKRRGSGETIWDIKKRIGYLSPELLLFFEQGSIVFDAVASGLFDTIGLFRQVSDQQTQLVYDWLQLLGVRSIARKRLNELSAGEQRKVLLARALIKNPPLLILDEPCQGLDDDTVKELIALIDSICRRSKKTLIYVTHYANRRPSCIDRFISLDKGVIV